MPTNDPPRYTCIVLCRLQKAHPQKGIVDDGAAAPTLTFCGVFCMLMWLPQWWQKHLGQGGGGGSFGALTSPGRPTHRPTHIKNIFKSKIY